MYVNAMRPGRHLFVLWQMFAFVRGEMAVVKMTFMWAAIYAAAPVGAVGGSVPCSRAPQSW